VSDVVRRQVEVGVAVSRRRGEQDRLLAYVEKGLDGFGGERGPGVRGVPPPSASSFPNLAETSPSTARTCPPTRTASGSSPRAVIPLRSTPAVERGDHKPPTCEHGEWRFAGSDFKRGASKWRCPTGECKPASVRTKASRLHPLIPRETPRFTALYRRRAAVEREFGRLKNEWALAPLRVRGLDRVKLHADLTILAKLACALSRARAVPLAA
jgi:hypothetical protein